MSPITAQRVLVSLQARNAGSVFQPVHLHGLTRGPPSSDCKPPFLSGRSKSRRRRGRSLKHLKRAPGPIPVGRERAAVFVNKPPSLVPFYSILSFACVRYKREVGTPPPLSLPEWGLALRPSVIGSICG